MKISCWEGVDSCSCICVVGGCGFVVTAGLAGILQLCLKHGQQGNTLSSVACVVHW